MYEYENKYEYGYKYEYEYEYEYGFVLGGGDCTAWHCGARYAHTCVNYSNREKIYMYTYMVFRDCQAVALLLLVVNCPIFTSSCADI